MLQCILVVYVDKEYSESFTYSGVLQECVWFVCTEILKGLNNDSKFLSFNKTPSPLFMNSSIRQKKELNSKCP